MLSADSVEKIIRTALISVGKRGMHIWSPSLKQTFSDFFKRISDYFYACVYQNRGKIPQICLTNIKIYLLHYLSKSTGAEFL